MKSDSNREMDLLLRRHARRKGRAVSGADEAALAGPHMDADEMNAYAEGALPAAARSRYVAHLADCDQCRAIVASLAPAANVALESEERDAGQASAPSASWREWLAALFAPPLMRYGAVAAALLCVVGVVFLAMRGQRSARQQDEPTYVAQNKQDEPQQPASAVKPGSNETAVAQPAPAAPVVGPAPEQKNERAVAGQTSANSSTATDALTPTQEANVPQPLSATKTDTPQASAAAPRPAESGPEQTANDQRDEDLAVTNRAAPPPTLTMKPGVAGGRAQEPAAAEKDKQTRKEGPASEGREQQSGAANNATAARESEEVLSMSRTTTPTTAARRRSVRKAEETRERSDAIGSSAAGATATETRSVGGRQFRREGGAWIDTAYGSGRATVNIKRGSEQYRALIADEPGLRSIAEELGGEVIVVWKGRAYRIR